MTASSASVMGVPRSRMFFRLSAHSPRDSGVLRMCCSSWQILHLFSVRVEPGPLVNLSGFWANPEWQKKTRTAQAGNFSNLNHYSDSVHAVPEIPERVPCRRDGLRVASDIPGARDERQVAEALRLVVEGKCAPRVAVAARRKFCALPVHAFVHRDLDAVDRALANPGTASHADALA